MEDLESIRRDVNNFYVHGNPKRHIEKVFALRKHPEGVGFANLILDNPTPRITLRANEDGDMSLYREIRFLDDVRLALSPRWHILLQKGISTYNLDEHFSEVDDFVEDLLNLPVSRYKLNGRYRPYGTKDDVDEEFWEDVLESAKDVIRNVFVPYAAHWSFLCQVEDI